MSLVFNDTSTNKGIIQMIEKECGFNAGDISGNATRFSQFTVDVNLAHDDFVRIAIQSSGTWQFDDSNQTDLPIIRTNLVSGQRDYSFVLDGTNNLILDFYKITVADTSGVLHEIKPVDQQTADSAQGNVDSFINGQNVGGVPTRYDKTGPTFFLDPVPNYNSTNGFQAFINREGYYFTTADTTKKPGVPGIFHKYYYLKPSLDYARRNSLSNYAALQNEVMKMEGDESRGIVGTIGAYFGKRQKDVRRGMVANVENCK